jgi:predicted O-methyltransferase YrrM
VASLRLRRVIAHAAPRLETERRVTRAAEQVRARAPRSLDDALDYVYRARPGAFRLAPIQVRSELSRFLELAQKLRPSRVLEIGTGRGGTLFLLTRIAAPDAVLVSIDLSSPDDLRFGGADLSRRKRLFEAFALDEQRVQVLLADSHLVDTREQVTRIFDGGQVDLLFIDGDHTTAGVSRDFELYKDLVRPGGLVAFHDIVDGKPELVGGVPDFWRAIKTPDALEFIADSRQGGYGIGVMRS